MIKAKIKEGMVLVRCKQYHGNEMDFLIWAEPSYTGNYRVQIRYEPAETFGKGYTPFKEKVKMIKEGHRPGSGNALPVEFTSPDAKRIVNTIANSKKLRTS